ncbi:MAG TPA: adenosylcobinamide-GDP ribazoletransferase [Fibrobacteria bacterium]|nr:adenosylcobinamide-GDP ribazoletransferase [Fibrobacteria bacterium]
MSLSNALSYLTVLPIPFKKHIPLSRSVHFFPLVGAGMGSVLVLVFLACKALLPPYLACIATVAVLEGMTGGIHLRAFAELIDGRRTFPGSGFAPKPEYKWRGMAAVSFLFFLKVNGLANTRPEWQPFAVLLVPILGRGSQALGIIFSRHRLESAKALPDPAVKRRQKRALFFTVALLCSMLLFPWRTAGILIAGYFALMVASYRFLNKRMEGLTVQTLGTVAELAEAGFLAGTSALS